MRRMAITSIPILSSERQLFIDDCLVSDSRGLRHTLHQPRRYECNPVFVGCFPWEGDRVAPAAVLRDPQSGRFGLWYSTQAVRLREVAATPQEKDRVAGYVCYAESDDGMHWRRPALGIHESTQPWKLPWDAPPQLDRTTANNIVMRSLALAGAERPELVMEFMCRDDLEADPFRRYKALVWQQGDRYKELGERGAVEAGKMLSGYRAAFSPDGLHWTQSDLVRTYPTFRDAGTAMHDRKNRRFVGFFKTNLREVRTRAIYLSDDLLSWSGPHAILEPDADDPPAAQLYDNSGFVYESVYLGTLGLFRAGEEATIEQQLIHSRDGVNWVRGLERQPFFPHGEPGADWDGGMVRALRPPVLVGEELWFYYLGFDGRHWQKARSAIGLAKLRRDGFVSMDAAEEGWLLTPALDWSGRYLCLNADAAGGRIEVEVCDEGGRALPGYGRAEAVPIVRDATRSACRWRGAAELPASSAAGDAHAPRRLRVYLTKARLYSLWVE